MKKIKVNLYEILGINLIPPFLKDGIVISFILHIFFLILIMVSPYIRVHSFIPKIKYDEPIIVDLENLIIGKETILSNIPVNTVVSEDKISEYSKPEVKKEELPPPPVKEIKSEEEKKDADSFIEDKKEKISDKPKVEEIAKDRMGGLDDLLASVDGLKHKDKKSVIKSEEKNPANIENETKNYQKNSVTDILKKQMAISYIDAIRIKLRSCWNLDPGAKDIKNMKIVIRTSVSPDGNISAIEILNKDEYSSSPWFKAVAESAKRALIICSPYNLPVEFYQDWKDIVFTFYPDKKSVQ